MQAPRLVASDLDGTLLGGDYVVSSRATRVINRAISAGVPFVFATGRPPRWIPQVADQLPAVQHAVCANGAVLYDIAADEVVWSRTLAGHELNALALAVAEVMPEARLGVERVAIGSGGRAAAEFVAEHDYVHAWPGADNSLEHRTDLLGRPAVKLLVRDPGMTSAEMVLALASLVGEEVDLTYSHPGGLVEVAPSGVTKATGVAEIAGRLGIDAADVLAFGDMPNDYGLLRWAGHGVAMGNSHPSLLDVADEITGLNTEDGLAAILERWF